MYSKKLRGAIIYHDATSTMLHDAITIIITTITVACIVKTDDGRCPCFNVYSITATSKSAEATGPGILGVSSGTLHLIIFCSAKVWKHPFFGVHFPPPRPAPLFFGPPPPPPPPPLTAPFICFFLRFFAAIFFVGPPPPCPTPPLPAPPAPLSPTSASALLFHITEARMSSVTVLVSGKPRRAA